MSALVEPSRWRPLGRGRCAPAGSIADAALFARLAAYKRTVAGAFVGLSPADVATRLPPGPSIISEKLDGETWFLHHDGTAATLLSPTGRALSGVPLTGEAAALLGSWTGLLAGELYVHGNAGRPRLMDLHAALGGGVDAQVERLRFAAFDLLVDREAETLRAPLADRVSRLNSLLGGGSLLHIARFETVNAPSGVATRFAELVTRGGAEGLVVHAGNGRTYKVKPELTLDAAVVGYAAGENGVSELLLALLTPDGRYQSIGRVRTGWRNDESRDLGARLGTCECASSHRAATDRGTLLRFVRPELVVEVRCNDLLLTDSKDQPLRRMQLAYSGGTGWSPLGPSPSISMLSAVFLRVREDKRALRPDVRFEQVSDLVALPPEPNCGAAPLPTSQLLRREVYTKTTRSGLSVRKLVAWRTNKHERDLRFPSFAVLFSGYSPGRALPLQTDLRVASSEATLHAFADAWLAENIKRGWLAASVAREHEKEQPIPEPPATVTPPAAATATSDAAATTATAADPRLPAVGTVLQKRDRHGAVRCECTVVEDGGIRYAGKLYSSLSGAAMAAAKDLGLASTTANGFSFWGLAKPAPRPDAPLAPVALPSISESITQPAPAAAEQPIAFGNVAAAAGSADDDPAEPPAGPSGPRLTIAFNRSSSPSFPVVRQRLDQLASLGSLAITRDDKGRELSFLLTLERGLVEATRRIANLLAIIQGWKTTEISLDGELLGRQQLVLFLEKLERVRRCWVQRKSQGPQGCRSSCRLGCNSLRLEPSVARLRDSASEPPWFAVGRFDGKLVVVDKEALHNQVAGERNAHVRLCPFFDAPRVATAIDGLPETLTADDAGWITLYDFAKKPAWIWPSGERTPWDLSTAAQDFAGSGVELRLDFTAPDADGDASAQPAGAPATPPRSVPATRYTDVLGQDAAVEAARDLIELPLRHADLFLRLGATPSGAGIILAGPPGTGKTLLARAVAGECGAHIEIVSGPALLSKWVGETEAALRAVFDRARSLAPAVILFDELDSIAPSRSDDSALPHHVSVVGQLLVLLDGLEARGQISVLATTNRPEHLDPALRRPGRFDQILWMGLPDQRARAAIFEHYLRALKLAPRLEPDRLAAELAAATPDLTGADIAFVCQRAALLCVREAVAGSSAPQDLAIARGHLLAAAAQLASSRSASPTPLSRPLLFAG